MWYIFLINIHVEVIKHTHTHIPYVNNIDVTHKNPAFMTSTGSSVTSANCLFTFKTPYWAYYIQAIKISTMGKTIQMERVLHMLQ